MIPNLLDLAISRISPPISHGRFKGSINRSFASLVNRSASTGRNFTAKRSAGQTSHRLALQQLDRNSLRATDEAHAHARTHRGRLLGELDALALELGRDRVDA